MWQDVGLRVVGTGTLRFVIAMLALQVARFLPGGEAGREDAADIPCSLATDISLHSALQLHGFIFWSTACLLMALALQHAQANQGSSITKAMQLLSGELLMPSMQSLRRRAMSDP